MDGYLTSLILFVALFARTVNGCELEIAALDDCLAEKDRCETCLGMEGGVVAWDSCSDSKNQFCDALNLCADSCGSCLNAYKQWATCYLDALPYGEEDCQLACGRSDPIDENTTSSVPPIQQMLVLTFLLGAALTHF